MTDDNNKKRLVFFSDTHFGSISGLLPPAFETSEGIIQPQNAGQQYRQRMGNQIGNEGGRDQ